MSPTLKEPYTLPCGLVLRNRLVKAALAEQLAENHSPGHALQTLYGAWAKGGWGAVMTGNVMVDSSMLGGPHDVARPPSKSARDVEATISAWKTWASVIQAEGAHAIMQINHPGRQSPRGSRSGQAIAPSSIPLNFGDSYLAAMASSIAFGTPREMSVGEIREVVQQFATTAKMAAQAGFAGVEIHAAHGYLLAQFLAPSSNKRFDDYGGSPVKRARLVKEILQAVREATPATFCVGLKINSADHSQEKGLAECLEQVKYIHESGGLDFLEISGGTYEKAEMVQGREDATPAPQEKSSAVRPGELKPTARTVKREAYFLEYAYAVRDAFSSVPLMVTGGFRTRIGMQNALSAGGCDIVGLGRPGVENPSLPKEVLLNDDVCDDDAAVSMDRVHVPWFIRVTGIKPLSAGLVTTHYQKKMINIVQGAERAS